MEKNANSLALALIDLQIKHLNEWLEFLEDDTL